MNAFIWPAILLMLFAIGPVISAITVRRALSVRWQILLLGFCALYGVGPILLALGSMGLADVLNCDRQTFALSCPQQPWLSGLLNILIFGHWFTALTLPSAILGGLGLLGSISYRLKNPGSAAMFYRCRRRGLLGGVCAGLAVRSHLPPIAVRIMAVALLVIMNALTLVAYGWAWIAFPTQKSAP